MMRLCTDYVIGRKNCKGVLGPRWSLLIPAFYRPKAVINELTSWRVKYCTYCTLLQFLLGIEALPVHQAMHYRCRYGSFAAVTRPLPFPALPYFRENSPAKHVNNLLSPKFVSLTSIHMVAALMEEKANVRSFCQPLY